MSVKTDDLRIRSLQEVIPPAQLLSEIPVSDRAAQTVVQARQAVQKILRGGDRRLIVITGPCSIHDHAQAIEYARLLKSAADALKHELLVVVRGFSK